MNAKILIISTLITFGFAAEEPLKLTWFNLKDVKFIRKFVKEESAYFLFPSFGKSVLALNGKAISIKGYIIPIDVTDGMYVVSANPMASCFFCGSAGPETMIEVHFKQKDIRHKTDTFRTLTGIFKINENDIDHLNYIMEEVVVSR